MTGRDDARLLGAQILGDVQTFVAALDTMFGGFRERAERDLRPAAGRGDGVSRGRRGAERDALREASYFVERLDAERMPLAGLVLNRVQTTAVPSLSRRAQPRGSRSSSRSRSRRRGGRNGSGLVVAAGLLRLHAERMRRREREHTVASRFHAAHPGVPATEVGAMAEDVHDLEGLRLVGDQLAG